MEKQIIEYNGFSFQMSSADASFCYHSGVCDDDVKVVAAKPYIREQLDRLTTEQMMRVLDEYGIEYDENDKTEIEECLVWVVAGDVTENHEDEDEDEDEKMQIDALKKHIANDVLYGKDSDVVTNLLLKAYNTYQEEERGGVDYIFNLNNQEDLKCCVEGGLTAEEIAVLYTKSKKTTPYFFFGENYKAPMAIINTDILKRHLINSLDDVVPYIVAYDFLCADYYALYDRYKSRLSLQ